MGVEFADAAEGRHRLDGKVALITGVGRGIGRAAARLFAAEGASVFGCDVDPATAAETEELVRSAGGTISALAPADLASPEAARSWIEAGVAEFGGIDILYNNAGAVRFGTIDNCAPDDWSFTLRNELDLVMWTTQAAWPHLIARGGGAIVNTGSTSALRGHTRLGQSAHTAAKAAVIGLTIQHAGEGSPHRIRVNSISPGPTDTPALRAVIGDAELPSPIPLGRLGQPLDIARCALFLASDEASWITAANVVVDGGMSMIDGAEPVMVSAGASE
jgi:meso-butanediol dehydrogenase / (S,S)-butanediol dehydrogenase / diacetyl reductase